MARLNEPEAPTTASAASSASTEAVESLKRRFLRQNRELARVNSNQSVKIRNLETQISQLVAENCQLRAESNKLRLALDEARATRTVQHVDAIKQQLQERLQDFERLIGSLGDVGKKRKSNARKSEIPNSSRQSPNQKVWRSERSIGDVLDLPQTRQQEGWLPTIVEDKHFPRRTLEPTEISNIIDDTASDSPDIGPPPTTFLDRRKSLEDVREGAQDDSAALPDFLSANFDTRRRRRETHVRRDSSLVSALDLSPSKEPNRPSDLLSSQPLRGGAKRKLDVTDRTSDPRDVAAKDADTLAFRRKREEATITPSEPVKTSPVRKALAPKPVNTDPVVSPRKTAGTNKPDDKPAKQLAETTSRQRREVKGRAPVHIDFPVMEQPPVLETDINLDLVKLEPKTPYGLDLFSPASTQPSEARAEGRSGTPPPSDLNTRVAADAGAGGRGSRRARNPVSYAEPSLNTKMRRPGKELVDAVIPGSRRASSKEPEVKAEAQSGMRTVVLNGLSRTADRSPSTSAAARPESTRPEPGSPLGSKADLQAMKSNVPADPADKAMAPAVPMSQDRRRNRMSIHRTADAKPTRTESNPALEQAMNNLDIYDIETSLSTSSSKTSGSSDGARPRSQGSNRPSSAGSNASTASAPRSGALERSRSSADLTKVRTSRRQTLSGSSETIKVEPIVRPRDSKNAVSAGVVPGKLDAYRKARLEKSDDRLGALGRRRSMML